MAFFYVDRISVLDSRRYVKKYRGKSNFRVFILADKR